MSTLTFPKTIGVVGGGQLGRMLAEAAAPLGVELVVLDPTPDCPASLGARDQIVAEFDDADAIAALAERADALTYEIELADPDLLERAGAEAGVPVHPSPDALRVTGDKLVEKRTLADRGIPVPAFRAVDDADDLARALDDLGRPAMAKARRGGYDGRGNAPVDSVADAEAAFGDLSDLVVEEFVPYDRELSVIGARGEGGTAAFPVVENVHREEILRETIAPARTSEAIRDRALEVAYDVLGALDGRGVFGIELFEADGEVLVNEIAPRPHNSGHYTIEGAVTSQFEQHARAVLGLPLGGTDLREPTVTANVLGDVRERRPLSGGAAAVGGADSPEPTRLRGVREALAEPGVSFHWYGKREVRPLRKMGHVTAVAGGATLDELLVRTRAVRDGLTFRE